MFTVHCSDFSHKMSLRRLLSSYLLLRRLLSYPLLKHLSSESKIHTFVISGFDLRNPQFLSSFLGVHILYFYPGSTLFRHCSLEYTVQILSSDMIEWYSLNQILGRWRRVLNRKIVSKDWTSTMWNSIGEKSSIFHILFHRQWSLQQSF